MVFLWEEEVIEHHLGGCEFTTPTHCSLSQFHVNIVEAEDLMLAQQYI